ncbi:GNAT family N-acetyltransferase [Phytomonospora sp. NPDC050363]|uniref:GNAT family N-acetyltransferase n=1 Tax=Phytomonospora sp. NPDC050363 TaxID=3155642 RepID=UPI0033C51FEA
MPDVKILPAGPDDAGELLTLQYAAYLSEARLYGRLDLPPLVQTIDSLLADFDTTTWKKAVHRGRIVGAIRARRDGGVLHVGRLMVAPDRQGEGIGTRLLAAVEDEMPGDVGKLALFTGHLSTANLRLYERHGYREIRREPGGTGVMLVHLEKTVAPAG